MISHSIFKAYDIRGIVGDQLTPEVALQIGLVLGSEVKQRGGKAIIVARDGRISGPELVQAVSEGLLRTGLIVVDIGMVPTPVGYFATHTPLRLNGQVVHADSCVVVTGSHNPPQYNGFKMVVRNEALYGQQIQDLYQRIVNQDFSLGNGQLHNIQIADQYIDYIVKDIQLARPMKVVVDTGNGVAGELAPRLLRALGCEVIELFTKIDGTFPNHHPDPAKPENLQDVIRVLKETDAELGLAFDGDGDRLGVVTKDGQIIYPDRQLMLFVADVLTRYPGGQIIYDVKCTGHLKKWIESHGGEAVMWRTGHSLIKAKLRETGAPLAGEMSGHIFFKDRWFGFDDGLYTAARLLELLTQTAQPSAILNALPCSLSTPELHIQLSEGQNVQVIERLKKEAQFEHKIDQIMIDGLRVEYADGFGLARASNTTPVIVMRFEADNPKALQKIQADFRAALLKIDTSLDLPF